MITTARLSLSLEISLLALAAVLGTGEPVSAQCPLPDGLDGGPCCALTTDAIPMYPKVTQGALAICWSDCGLSGVLPRTAVWTPIKLLPSSGADCGYRRTRLAISSAAGLEWSGTMNLLYSRTWLETDPAGVPLQVWRFLVNGDLRSTPLVPPGPCTLPPCALAFGGLVRFTGYIDCAASCLPAGGVQYAWMLSHTCDFIDHAPGFPRAGVFHPGFSYSFVGPAIGFVPAAVVPVEGTPFSPFESVRRLRVPAPGTAGRIRCEYEEPFTHSLGPIATFCPCATAIPVSAQWAMGGLTGGGACGTTIATTGFPFLPGFLSMGIGSWTLPGMFPGAEDVRWNAGGYDYTDGCTGVVMPEVFYGVTTLGGYPAMQVTAGGPGMPLPLTFIDQANSIVAVGAPVMNVPFRSNHVLNLNE